MDGFIEDEDEAAAPEDRPRAAPAPVRQIIRVVERAPSGPAPQRPFQPGATQPDPLAIGLNRGTCFLVYNHLGYISSGPGPDEECASVDVSEAARGYWAVGRCISRQAHRVIVFQVSVGEVLAHTTLSPTFYPPSLAPLALCPPLQISFHDTSKMPSRPPVLSDPWGLTMASMGISGALHASPTTLVYRWVGGLLLSPSTPCFSCSPPTHTSPHSQCTRMNRAVHLL
jgi:hypothetical protein